MTNSIAQTNKTAFEKVINELAPRKLTDNEMATFIAVCADQDLDPLLGEIYPVEQPGSGPMPGRIIPLVGVDGWIKVANRHPEFDGVEFSYSTTSITMDGAKPCPEWCECIIYRKDKNHPTKVREYLDEVFQDEADHWLKTTKRQLRHKALAQTARVAFGLQGVATEAPELTAAQPQPEKPKMGLVRNMTAPAEAEVAEAAPAVVEVAPVFDTAAVKLMRQLEKVVAKAMSLNAPKSAYSFVNKRYSGADLEAAVKYLDAAFAAREDSDVQGS
tara:strand:+ start:1333 stop:2151 length:819 start_codon:yes stop_codon:yes gene_type:complete